ncbi:MAG: ABC transporter ATP-binding protein [Fervidicoccus fontis]|jgi:ABC-2 type transport system ATP-binding protein
MWVIETENLTKIYGGKIEAVKDLSLKVREGEIFGLLGPNGAGKTTTVCMLSTTLKPTYGKAYVFGYDVLKSKDEVRKRIILVTQEPSIELILSTYENLYFYAWINGVPKSERKTLVEKVMNDFGLTKYANVEAGRLSGGLQRRLQLARAFLVQKELLFLDEPTLGIDIEGKISSWNLIKQRVKENGITVVLATNDLYEAEKLCDRICFINRGRLIKVGSKDEIKKISSVSVATIKLSATTRSVSEIANTLSVYVKCLKDEQKLEIFFDNPNIFSKVLSILYSNGIKIEDIEIKKPTLEEAFVKLLEVKT